MEGVYNHSKIAFHREKLESLARGEVTSPIYVRIKPTNKCNHHCFYCTYDPNYKYILSERKNAKDEIPPEKMGEILDDFKTMGVKAVTYSGGGEPLVYPAIEGVLEKTLRLGIDLSIITNGQKLNGRRAELLSNSEWVRISADYCNPELFAKHRNISERFFKIEEENIRRFARMKKPECELGVNFLITHLNAEYVYDSAKFFKELGVNHIRFTPIYVPHGNKLCPGGPNVYHAPFKERVAEQLVRVKELEDDNFKVFNFCDINFDSVMVSKRLYPRCFMMEIVPVIAANQNVYFCHDKAYSDSGLIGSIKNQSFKELWFSPETAERFRTFKPQESCRHHCTGNGRNLIMEMIIKDLTRIEEFTPKSEKHKNFI